MAGDNKFFHPVADVLYPATGGRIIKVHRKTTAGNRPDEAGIAGVLSLASLPKILSGMLRPVCIGSACVLFPPCSADAFPTKTPVSIFELERKTVAGIVSLHVLPAYRPEYLCAVPAKTNKAAPVFFSVVEVRAHRTIGAHHQRGEDVSRCRYMVRQSGRTQRAPGLNTGEGTL